MAKLSFKKNLDLQNILFDEFFTELNHISILEMNYDGKGSSLCRCDASLTKIPIDTVNKIIFGTTKEQVEYFLQSIFDPNADSEDITRQDGNISFRLPELQKIKKYDVDNLAKETLRKLQDQPGDTFVYFEECTEKELHDDKADTTHLYGNTSSKVFHRSDCKSFNSISCTSMFSTRTEAMSAGFKPCGLCKP